MAKYKEQIQDMLEAHKEMFISFKALHDNYVQDSKTWQKKFNEEGQDILRIIKKWENSLCSKTESGKYGKFSSKLNEKFWEEIKEIFPKIDFIGIC